MNQDQKRSPDPVIARLTRGVKFNKFDMLDKYKTSLFSTTALWHYGFTLVLVLVTVILASPAPLELKVGSYALNTIRADRDIKIYDPEATLRNQEIAAANTLPVFILDDLDFELSDQQVGAIFVQGRNVLAGASDLMYQNPLEFFSHLENLKQDFFNIFHLPEGSPLWNQLLAEGFSSTLERELRNLAFDSLSLGIIDQPQYLTEFNHRAVKIVTLSNKAEHTVNQARIAIITLDEAEAFLKRKARFLYTQYDKQEADLITSLAVSLLHANTTFDSQETERQYQLALQAAPSAYKEIKAGEVVVREGFPISPAIKQIVDAINSGRDTDQWFSRIFGLCLILLVFFFVNIVMWRLSPKGFKPMKLKNQIFLFTLLLMGVLMAYGAGGLGSGLVWEYGFLDRQTLYYLLPIPTISMLGTIFLGLRKGVIVALFASILATIVMPGDSFYIFLYTYSGAVAAMWSLRSMTERKDLIPSSAWVAVTNCLTLVGLTFFSGQWNQTTIYNFVAAAMSGILSGIMASGLMPLIEMTFGFSTHLKMLELANLDRPILRELMLTAPGTYHHSVIVGAMVEAAAESIGANPFLAKAGAYYHDIGKLTKPLYFVENQRGENRHDTLSPSMSALVLIGHVKDGVELAHQNRLPQPIVDIVEQHHGTGLMAFFFNKAKELRQAHQAEINEGDFRYPGPRPQSKEAGLVMLADICEAATRAMSEPTPVKIQNLVRHLVNQTFNDGQLDDCRLSLKELSEAIKSFNTILIGIYHHRVAYPGGKKSETEATEKRPYEHLPDNQVKRTTH